ncbi:MAG: efflux transporter periplasmic adaptor subunit, partial [Rhodospirillales bacterium]|nr:efflux transporter periplasmic adaptor subunit [Rhodospirillales bacterium]
MGNRYRRQFAPALIASVACSLLAAALFNEPAAAQSTAEKSVLVEAVPVTVRALKRTIQAVGSLRSQESVIIRPEIPGIVKAIQFNEG